MNFRTLRMFVEVVRQGGFTRAAEAVFATQSTVSKAVRQLEDEVGVPLIDRAGQRVGLTAAGEVVHRRALRILAEQADLMREIDEIRGLQRGTLRLGLPPIGSSVLFAPVLASYRARYPGVDIHLVEHGSSRLEEVVRAGELDLAGSLLPVSEEFAWQDVRREPLMALLSRDHPLAKAGAIGIDALRDIPFILFESGFALNRIIVEACRRRGFTPQVAVRSSQVDFIVELAASGLGVAFLPRLMTREQHRHLVAQVLLDHADTDWHMAMVWRRDAYLSHAARAWLACLREGGRP
ncbi:LysR family transcriptional regulator [Acidimangrovimonas sediminis]|uniref:LysR family transcriptional regulator n=1 Tax=Acidimangrovimonas sediminis TaxID=2056283 RepID=UPI000C8023E1|nr:LysR family transcriptional regulator [Acidimangrovimonas sediminis]